LNSFKKDKKNEKMFDDAFTIVYNMLKMDCLLRFNINNDDL
jgi:hypothetical protein